MLTKKHPREQVRIRTVSNAIGTYTYVRMAHDKWTSRLDIVFKILPSGDYGGTYVAVVVNLHSVLLLHFFATSRLDFSIL